jgi:two-component system LytT family response regulator
MNNKNLKAVIIEDEAESLQLLENLLENSKLAEVIGSSTDASEALDLIVTLKPDILFLDIKMPGKSGFEILDDLQKMKSVKPFIVFTTAYDEFAIKAFEYAAFDYLLKPIDPYRLASTILRCADNLKSGKNQPADILLGTYRKLQFRNTSGIAFIDPSEIVCVKAGGNYSVFNLASNKTETVTMLLGKVEEQLPSDTFFRAGRSDIINLDYLKKINTKQLQCILVKNGFEFKCDISRERIGELLDRMRNR